MLVKTQGLVLHTTPYSESSAIAKVFTERLGVRSYILKGVRRSHGHHKQGLLRPLSWLDMVVYDTSGTTLNHVKEISPVSSRTICDEAKKAVVFFMDELLYRTLRENEPMEELFRYVTRQLERLEDETVLDVSMPIEFLIGTSKLLGIGPLDNHSIHEPFFSLTDGRYVGGVNEAERSMNNLVEEQRSLVLHNYLEAVYGGGTMPIHPAATRNAIVNLLIDYYHIHVTYFGDFKSHEILHTVLS